MLHQVKVIYFVIDAYFAAQIFLSVIKRNIMDRDQNKNEQESDFPGYPHYSPEEDITNPGNGNRKVDADVEKLANSSRLSQQSLHEGRERENSSERDAEDDDIRIVPGTEADVTAEDLVLLGDPDGDQDMNDDELLRTSARVDEIESESDLDIPIADEEGDSDSMDQGDEENDYYSLGGDRHENLDEDQAGSQHQ